MTSVCCLLSESYRHGNDISVRRIFRNFDSEKHGDSPGTVGTSRMSGDICVFFSLDPVLFWGGKQGSTDGHRICLPDRHFDSLINNNRLTTSNIKDTETHHGLHTQHQESVSHRFQVLVFQQSSQCEDTCDAQISWSSNLDVHLTNRPSLFSKVSLKTRGPRWSLCESRALVRVVVAVTTNLHRSQVTTSGHASSTESSRISLRLGKEWPVGGLLWFPGKDHTLTPHTLKPLVS